jgi:hypothetical protein
LKFFTLIAISILWIYSFTEVHAAGAQSQCSGVLRQDRGQLYISDLRGERKGICVINKDELAKVFAGCRVGQKCSVKGAVDDCNDSSECVVISDVNSVTRE